MAMQLDAVDYPTALSFVRSQGEVALVLARIAPELPLCIRTGERGRAVCAA